ncbi:hypothetical protein D3C76_1706200 [compost metagenome]
MNADEQGKHHHDFGKGHKNTGDEHHGSDGDVALRQRDDARHNGIFLACTVDVNHRDGQQVSR